MQRTYQNKPQLKEFRRNLRQRAVTAEQILWKFLRKKQTGYKFRRQFGIENYIADFYCQKLKLVIELDGWTHDFEKTQNKDIEKQAFLEKMGYKVIRIKNEEVFGDIDKLINKIKQACELRATTLVQTLPFIPPLATAMRRGPALAG